MKQNKDLIKYQITGLKEIMLCDFLMNQNELANIDPASFKQMIEKKLLNESFQVFLLEEKDFILKGKKKIKSSLSVNKKNQNSKIQKNFIRLVFWEELERGNVYIDVPDKINSIEFSINCNSFDCMDDWGHVAFTDYKINCDGEKTDIDLNSESFGYPKDIVGFLINHKKQCENIRIIYNFSYSDIYEEVSDTYHELNIKDKNMNNNNDGKNYFINCNKSRDASTIEWANDTYKIHDLEPYISSIDCDDGEDFHFLIHADSPDADGKDDFKTIDLDGFEAIEGDNENEFILCFTAVVNINLDKHHDFKKALEKSDNMVVARIGFKKNGKPILDSDGYQEHLFEMCEDVAVELELDS